jgi:hypothetical protein
MSYADIAAMVEDWELRMRLVACAAQEQHDAPVSFVEDNIWRICAHPGFTKAWGKTATATANDPDYKPGGDESVISDAMIQAGVQRVLGDLQTKVTMSARAVEDDTAARLDAEEEREFRRHVRIRQWEIENTPGPDFTPVTPTPEEPE